jgi:hypothetical protein
MAYDFCPYVGLICDGWTREEILARLTIVDAAIMAQSPGTGMIQSASLNGKSISFDNSGATGTPYDQLRVQKRELLQGLALCDDDVHSPADKTTVNMSGRYF